jgi:hypothetical protein
MPPNCIDRLVAFVTAAIVAARNPLMKQLTITETEQFVIMNPSTTQIIQQIGFHFTYPCSKASTPAMVVPPGDVTPSLSSPGCFPVSSTI